MLLLLFLRFDAPVGEMRELLEQVKPRALRERLVKVWAKL